MDILLSSGLVIFLLIFVRLGATLMLVPLFGASNVPINLKVLFTGFLSLIFLVNQPYSLGLDVADFSQFTMGIINEIVNGLTVGFVVVAVMNAIYIAGHIIDMNMGFAMVNVISAQDESEMPITANFYYLLIMILFVLTNAHHHIILAFNKSLATVPLGKLAFNVLHLDGYLTLIQDTFVIGFQIALPIIATTLIANIILGMLSKAMPGMNVFMVGMPFKIMIGLATLRVVFPVTIQTMHNIIDLVLRYIYQFVQAMG